MMNKLNYIPFVALFLWACNGSTQKTSPADNVQKELSQLSATIQEIKEKNLPPQEAYNLLYNRYHAIKDSLGHVPNDHEWSLKSQELKNRLPKAKAKWKDWPLDSFVGKPFILEDDGIRKVFKGRVLNKIAYFNHTHKNIYSYRTWGRDNSRKGSVIEAFHHVFTVYERETFIPLGRSQDSIAREKPDRIEFYDDNYSLIKTFDLTSDGPYTKKMYPKIKYEKHLPRELYRPDPKHVPLGDEVAEYATTYDIRNQYNGKFTYVISRLYGFDESGYWISTESTVQAFDTIGQELVNYVVDGAEVHFVYLTPNRRYLLIDYQANRLGETVQGLQLVDLKNGEIMLKEEMPCGGCGGILGYSIPSYFINAGNKLMYYDKDEEAAHDRNDLGFTVIVDPLHRVKYKYRMYLGKRDKRGDGFLNRDLKMYLDSLEYDEKIKF